MGRDPDEVEVTDAMQVDIDDLNTRVTTLESVAALQQQSIDDHEVRIAALESSPDPDPEPEPDPDPPPTGEVLTWAEIEAGFVASYKTPVAQVGSNEMGYSKAPHAQLADGSLLIHGHSYYGAARKFQIPSSGDTLEVAGDWMEVKGTKPESVGGTWNTGGIWEAPNGDIHVSGVEYYNGSGGNQPTFRLSPDGPWKYANHHNGALGGAISNAPSGLPFDFICGECGQSAQNPRSGVNVFGVSVDANGDYTSTALIAHDTTNPMAGWWIADAQHSAVFVEHAGKSALLVFVSKGLTNLRYGERDEGGYDHYNGGKGYHADSYEAAVLVYDPGEINAVLAGSKQPHEVNPVEHVRLVHGDENGVVTHQSVITTGNPVGELHATISGGRLLILQEAGYAASPYSKTPMVYEFQV